MATTTLDLDDLKRHIGRRQVSADIAAAGPANLLRLALGRPEPEIAAGAPVPPGWQILDFLTELRPRGAPSRWQPPRRRRGPTHAASAAHVRGRADDLPPADPHR